MEMRFDAFDARDVQDSMLDHVCFVRALDVAVQERDVVRDHHVYVRQVELLQDRPERRADPIGEHVVGHVRVRLPSGQAVEDSRRVATSSARRASRSASRRMARPPGVSGAAIAAAPTTPATIAVP